MSRRKAPPAAQGFTNPYVVKGLRYAEDVVAGNINAGRLVRLSCKRQLDDLERAKDPAWPFRFDEELGGRAAEFMEQLPHTQGPKAFRRDDGSWNTLVLEPWQCFIETTLYGWVRKDDGSRRFTRAYEEEPRGQGKSLRLSGALLYSFTEGEQGVEAYSAAVDREQAAKVYGEAEAMLLKRPELAAELGLETSAHAIYQAATNSKAKALSREAKKTGDGKNVYFAAVDEFHAHPTRDVWGILDTGTGKRGGSPGRGAMIRIITTAGFNTGGVCFARRAYCIKILEGRVKDDAWFAIIFAIDEDDDWADEECRNACSDHSHPRCVWRKANPNWGISVDPKDFHQKAMTAIQDTHEQNDFLVKHLCVWTNSAQQWIPAAEWDRCADPSLGVTGFSREPLFIGLDLGSTSDITAKVRLFLRDMPMTRCALCDRAEEDHPAEDCAGFEKATEGATERHYFLFLDSYLPEAATAASKNPLYAGWVKEGKIITTRGNVTDYRVIRDGVLADRDRFNIREVPYDPYNANELTADLTDEGVPMVKYDVNVKNFSPAMKEFERYVRTRRLHHDGNPVLRWMLSNVFVKEDNKGNLFPRKQGRENKIDGVMAALSALGRAMDYTEDEGSSSYLDDPEAELLVLS